MYTGNPHQDRYPWKSFTGGFRQGWGDRRRSLNKDANKAFTSGWKDGWQGPLGIQTAELTQKQKDFMGSPYNTPDFGVSKKELWDKTKGMEKKGFFGWGAQEPTTIQEFNDYYNQLEQGKAGNWLASNSYYSHPNFGRGNKRYDGTFRQEGYGDPNAKDPWGQDWDYRDDDYDINVLDPGFTNYGPGPLYFG